MEGIKDKMNEAMKEILIVLIRVVTILPLLLIVTIFMGKRAIGELPIFDYLIIITLGAVAGADIGNPDIKQMPTVAAIIALAILQRIVARLKISNRRFEKLLTFEPSVVIQDGKFIKKNLKKNRYSIDNILHMLREKGIFDVNDVETAIIEETGSLSVLKKPHRDQVTLGDIGIRNASSAIAFPVIMDGVIYINVLKKLSLNEKWLQQQLEQHGVRNVNDVFFASLNSSLEMHISLKDDSDIEIPPIES